jgi:hypothetical protein
MRHCTQSAQAGFRCILIMTVSSHIYDAFAHDKEHFRLFIENKNGDNWNQFVRGLCSLYFACDNENHKLNSGLFYAVEFVEKYYSEFLVNLATCKRRFLKSKKEVILETAADLVNQEYTEFEIGNVVEF